MEETLPVDANIGRVLAGQYRIDALLGEGGMGTVYRGLQLSVKRPVAIKLISGAVASNPECVRRFQREAEAMARVHHPNTVRLFDFGVEKAELFMVMELLEGEDLSQRLERTGALALPEALGIVRQTLLALSEAHTLGIVHRDLKPANVFLWQVHNGQVFAKVMDFGIAGIEQEAASTKLTMQGAVLGTPAYMSPEQAQGAVVDARSDLYSLGVMLFEMVTGRAPFVSESVVSLLLAHVSQPPPQLNDVRSDLGQFGELQLLLDALLQKQPAARPPSAAAVLERVEALQRALELKAAAGGAATVPEIAQPPVRPRANGPPSVPLAATPLRSAVAITVRPKWGGLRTAVLVLGSLLVLAFVLSRRRDDAATSASAPLSAEGEEGLHSVHIRSAPWGASVALAGVEIGKTPYELKFRRETKLSVALPGYVTQELTVKPESEPNLVVELVAAPKAESQVGAPSTELRREPVRRSEAPIASTPRARVETVQPKAHEPEATPEPSATAAPDDGFVQPAPAQRGSSRPIPWLKRTVSTFIGDLTGDNARRPPPQHTGSAPSYGNVADAKRAYRAGHISAPEYEDNIRTLKTRRAQRIEAEKQRLRNGAISRDEYKLRVNRIDDDYEGS